MRTLQSARAPDGHPASYEVRTQFDQENGHYITLVRAYCIECGEAYDLRWDTGGNHPDFIVKKFKQLGWQFDAYKPRKCVCAICMGTRRDRFVAKNNSLSEEHMTKSSTNRFGDPSYVPVKPASDTGVATVSTAAEAVTTASAEAIRRSLSAAQKAKIRLLLDSHFDDSKGRYIDDYNDKRVGVEADVPWKVVEEIREFAYGPLRDDPLVALFKAEAVALRDEFKFLQNTLSEKVSIHQRDFTEMMNMVKKIEGRLINVEAKANKL